MAYLYDIDLPNNLATNHRVSLVKTCVCWVYVQVVRCGCTHWGGGPDVVHYILGDYVLCLWFALNRTSIDTEEWWKMPLVSRLSFQRWHATNTTNSEILFLLVLCCIACLEDRTMGIEVAVGQIEIWTMKWSMWFGEIVRTITLMTCTHPKMPPENQRSK